MLQMHDEIDRAAQQYRERYGVQTDVYIQKDIHVATAAGDWNKVKHLRRVQLRIHRFQLCQQAARRFSALPAVPSGTEARLLA